MFCNFTKTRNLSHPDEILKKYWGFSALKESQKQIIDSVLERRDTLGILPTGGGKSLCYQIPALLFDGITLVISPLIALMQDQVDQLNKMGIGAAFISSQLKEDELNTIYTKSQNNQIKLLYISPERLESQRFLQQINQINVNFIAIDEAHCIAQWGHDFRPSYLKIHKIRTLFPSSNLLALTATATPKIQEEIISALELKNPTIFKQSLKRKNLVFTIRKTQNELDDLVYELKKNPGSSIVFTRTRKKTYEVAQFLQNKNLDAEYFHAKLPADEKQIKQQIWTLSDKQIMVSTNAFGMGIDKPNVRSVFHLDLPSSLEAYVQEAGRAGRDQNKAECILFLQPFAAEETENIFKSSLPTKQEYQQIWRMFYNYFEIGENERPDQKLQFDLHEFSQKFNLDKKKSVKVLDFLERKEIVYFQKFRQFSSVQLLTNPNKIQFSKNLPSQILEYLVRNYPGIGTQEKNINEFSIARNLNKSVKKIKTTLSKLNQTGHLIYRNRDVQNVLFLRPRETDYLNNTIWKEFEKLQIVQWKRLQDLIFYANQNEVCREKLLLRYFGEKTNENCGNCDICKKSFQNVNEKEILEFMGEKPTSIQEILAHFITIPKENILHLVQKMCDEEWIEPTQMDIYQKIG